MTPTIGVERFHFHFLDFTMNIMDLGGQKNFREYYFQNSYLFKGIKLLIHVVDVQDQNRFTESRTYLDKMLQTLQTVDVIPEVFIFFHKFDTEKEKFLLSNLELAHTIFSDYKKQFETSILGNSACEAFRQILSQVKSEFAAQIKYILKQFKNLLIDLYLIDQEGWILDYSSNGFMPIKCDFEDKEKIKSFLKIENDIYEGRINHICFEENEVLKRIYFLSNNSPKVYLFVRYHINQEWNKSLDRSIKTLVDELKITVDLLKN